MDALAALGKYEDGSDSGSDEEMHDGASGASAAAAAAASAAAISAANAAARSSSLPDASGLGLPDIWTSHGDDDDDDDVDEEPAHDPKGTSYNTVSLPSCLASAGAPSRPGRQSGHKPATIPVFSSAGGGAPSSDGPAAKRQAVAPPQAPAQPRRASAGSSGGGQLLPPQLRRPNVVTEDSGAWSSKPKPRRNS